MNSSRVMNALVIEDQELFREAVADELSFFGFKTSTAVNGEEGLKSIKQTEYDLILSDIRMPIRDGRWLLSELRKIRRISPPFIFMTGFTELSPREAFHMGADGFVGKPFDSERLEKLIKKVCRPMNTRWSTCPTVEPTIKIAKNFLSIAREETRQTFLLGRGGIFLALDQSSVKVGEKISFSITFHEGPILKIEGTGSIVWREDLGEGSKQTGYGIDFDYITPETLDSLIAYLSKMDSVPVIPKGELNF